MPVMSGEFIDMRGTAHDLQGWHELLTGDAAPFQRIEAAPEAGEFNGRFWRVVLDQVSMNLMEIEASQHTISRTAEHIKALAEPYYLVLFQVRGSSVFRQDSRASALEAGDFVVTTSTDPYTWEFHGDFATFALRFPQSFIDLPEPMLRPVIGQAIAASPDPHGTAFAARLSPFVTAVVADAELLRGPLGGRVARNLIDLFATALYGALGGAATDRGVPVFLRATDYIARHLGEPGLETAAVARAHHLSVRYLQAIFAEQGTTVTGWIRDRRLAGCRRDLADPALRDVPIGDVAARWGYPDQAYFSRLFRRTFSETPREWRVRAVDRHLAGD
jgi:AraC-like DNA-binding protein